MNNHKKNKKSQSFLVKLIEQFKEQKEQIIKMAPMFLICISCMLYVVVWPLISNKSLANSAEMKQESSIIRELVKTSTMEGATQQDKEELEDYLGMTNEERE